ncbi:hypothetical protein N9L76_02560 [bacterium]|nr:hypothetical protein [bacterium]
MTSIPSDDSCDTSDDLSGDSNGVPSPPSTRRRSKTRREMLSTWIANTTGHTLDSRSDKGFCEGLWDGVVLCRVLQTLVPGVAKELMRADDPKLVNQTSPDKFLHTHNYKQFIAGAVKIGVADDDLFSIQDLGGISGEQTNVLRCLVAVKRICEDSTGDCLPIGVVTIDDVSASPNFTSWATQLDDEPNDSLKTPPPTVYVPTLDFGSIMGGFALPSTHTDSTMTKMTHSVFDASFAESLVVSGAPTTDSPTRRPSEDAGSFPGFNAQNSPPSCATMSLSPQTPNTVVSVSSSCSSSSDSVDCSKSDASQLVSTVKKVKKKSKSKKSVSYGKDITSQDAIFSAVADVKAEYERKLSDLRNELSNARVRMTNAFRREAGATAQCEIMEKHHSKLEKQVDKFQVELETLKAENDALRKANDNVDRVRGTETRMETAKEMTILPSSSDRDELFNELSTTRETLTCAMRFAEECEGKLKVFESENQTLTSQKETFETRIGQTTEALKFLRDEVVPSLRVSLEETKNTALRELGTSQRRFVGDLAMATSRLAKKATLYDNTFAENKKLHFQIQDLKGSIRVFCRVRPTVKGLGEENETIHSGNNASPAVVARTDENGTNNTLTVFHKERRGSEVTGVSSKTVQKHYTFDKTFGPSTSQSEVYSETSNLIRCVADGYNACLLAYGQTGSGKTHTMSGPTNMKFKNGPSECHSQESLGVNYRALEDLFALIEDRKSVQNHVVTVSVLEIYNEECRDLLAKRGGHRIEIKGDVGGGSSGGSKSNGSSYVKFTTNNVPDAVQKIVNTPDDVAELMIEGEVNRSTGATAMNARSSRSHSVVIVKVTAVSYETKATSRGVLYLVDLAGSERVLRSEASGDRLKEAQHINKSLSALGDVVSALQTRQTHVPYRNSKLTTLLRGALGPNGKALLFAHVSPTHASTGETISTLAFATRAASVELGKAQKRCESSELVFVRSKLDSMQQNVASASLEMGNTQRELSETQAKAGEWERRARLAEARFAKKRSSVGGTSSRSSGSFDASVVFKNKSDTGTSRESGTSRLCLAADAAVAQNRMNTRPITTHVRSGAKQVSSKIPKSRNSLSSTGTSVTQTVSDSRRRSVPDNDLDASYFDEQYPADAFSSDLVGSPTVRVNAHTGSARETDESELRKQAAAAAMSVTAPVLDAALSPLSALANASFIDSDSPVSVGNVQRAPSVNSHTQGDPIKFDGDLFRDDEIENKNSASSAWRSAYKGISQNANFAAAPGDTDSVIKKKKSMYSRTLSAFGFSKKKTKERGRWQ